MAPYSKENFKADVAEAKLLQKKHGTSYYFATAFMPARLRDATYTLYAFFRVPDEIVDSSKEKSISQIQSELTTWEHDWKLAYESAHSVSPILRATAYVFHHYKIPFTLSTDFLSAMMQDTEKSEYVSYGDLEQYMYGSAGVVGIMMSYIIGFKNDHTLAYAEKLGEAMQMTNFLRDIGEDYRDRGRIYMPRDELGRFNITDEIQTGRVTEGWKEFMKFQIARTRKLYKESEIGIEELDSGGQLAVKLASVLYARILNKIEEANYDCLNQRVRTSFPEKLQLALPTSIRHITTL